MAALASILESDSLLQDSEGKEMSMFPIIAREYGQSKTAFAMQLVYFNQWCAII